MRLRDAGRRGTTLLLFLLLAGGCAGGLRPVWVAADAPFRSAEKGFAVELPADWMRVNREDRVLATRDGIPLQ